MKISVELSLYPLGREDPIAEIIAFIDDVRGDARLDVAINQLSTQITGELDDVMAVLTAAMRRSFGGEGTRVLVAKFLSKAQPIHEPPVLER